jgi:glycerophosphoryl diester phosphodiesterase
VTRPIVIAHRGDQDAGYENSLAAFRAAAPAGADAVELDIHATTDGVLYVHHDFALGGIILAQATAAQVAALRLPNGDPVPTLTESLAAIGPRLRVFVEVKSLAPQWDGRLFETLDRGPNPKGYAVHGFDHRIVARLKQQRPALPAGVLSASYLLDNVAQARAAGAEVLWEDQALIDAALVRAVHDAGLLLYAWTPNDAAELTRLRDLGVDGLCSNHPKLARRIADGMPA